MKLSKLFTRQIPAYVKENYPQFVLFIKKYYEFLEKIPASGKLYNSIIDKDVSTNSQIAAIIKALESELAYSLPKTLLEEQFFLQHVKELYLSKGSEESFKYLFRALFNTEVELYYPSEQILKTSDGQWHQDYSVFVRGIVGNGELVAKNVINVLSEGSLINTTVLDVKDRTDVNKELFALDAGHINEIVSAIKDFFFIPEEVEKILDLQNDILLGEYYNKVYEMTVDRDYYGKLKVNDIIVFREGLHLFVGQILPSTTKSKLYTGGTGFRVGQTFDISTEYGKGSSFKITEVGRYGTIKHIDFYRFGFGYSTGLTLALYNTGIYKIIFQGKDPKNPLSQMSLQLADYTKGYFEKGYFSGDMDYVFGMNSLINYAVVNGGHGYTQANVSITPSSLGSDYTPDITPIFGDFPIKQLDGLVKCSKSSDVAIGTNTRFLNEVEVGDVIKTYSGVIGKVKQITSDTSLKLYSNSLVDARYTPCEIIDSRLIALNIHPKSTHYEIPPTITITGDGTGAEIETFIGTEIYWELDYCGHVSLTDSSNLYCDKRYWDLDYCFGGNYPSFKFAQKYDVVDESDIAYVTVVSDSVVKYPGYYESNNGFLSDDMHLQDGKYYQQFSYEIKSNIPMDKYDSYIRTTIHPAGMIAFGNYTIDNTLDMKSITATDYVVRKFILSTNEDVINTDYLTPTSIQYTASKMINDSMYSIDSGNYRPPIYVNPVTPEYEKMWGEYTEGDVEYPFSN